MSRQTLVGAVAFAVSIAAGPASAARLPTTTHTSMPSSSASVSPLTIADARANINSILRHRFGGRFTSHRHYKRRCYRLTTQKVRCRVRWDHGRWRYAGTVDMRNDPEDPEGTIIYTTTIRRKRLHASSTGPSSGGSGGSSGAGSAPTTSSCDPNYSGACLDPDASDYDCAGGSGNGPLYVQGPLTVVGRDHYDLDADGDGVACEG
jgi:hypothetical protein